MTPPAAIVVMGVSGCGKSTLAAGLAERLGYRFIEGDSLHPKANVERMSAGLPLGDEDRWPWLDRVAAEMNATVQEGQGAVATCSALRKAYRDRLRDHLRHPPVFLWLDGAQELIAVRMAARAGHFMPQTLLASQFATLEPPAGEADVIRLDISATMADMLRKALAALAART